MTLSDDFLAHPCVFAVDTHYQIMLGVNRPSILWFEIDGISYTDSIAGVYRSDTATHSVRVPMHVLDKAEKYTVCYRNVIDRKPYYPELEDVVRIEYPFKPLKSEGKINLYHISDAHSRVDAPVSAGSYFGNDLDLLVLNGDVLNHAGSSADMQTVLLVGGKITKGGIPIVCSRGNHDMRGFYAERVQDYLPSYQGGFYYTFRLGCIWGVVLDCAEDKADGGDEYGGTIVCHAYREAQTAMLHDLIARKKEEYDAPGIAYRLVIAHKPFSHQQPPPFNIEEEVYREWCRLLSEQIHPDLMICGHHHDTKTYLPGCDFDHYGQPCPLIVGSKPLENGFVGCAITLDGRKATVAFTDHEGALRGEENILLEN